VATRVVEITFSLSFQGDRCKFVQRVCAFEDGKSKGQDSDAKKNDVDDLANTKEMRPRPHSQRAGDEGQGVGPEHGVHGASRCGWQDGNDRRIASAMRSFEDMRKTAVAVVIERVSSVGGES
jgi:hypothetical protein